MDTCNWKNAEVNETSPEIHWACRALGGQRQGRRRIQSSVHRARQLQQRQNYLTLISKLSSYGWRRKWRSFSVLSGHDDRSSQSVTVAWWRKIQRSTWICPWKRPTSWDKNEDLVVVFAKIFYGHPSPDVLEERKVWKMGGTKYRHGKVLACREKALCVSTWTRNNVGKTDHGNHVEHSAGRNRLGRSTAIDRSSVLEMHAKGMQTLISRQPSLKPSCSKSSRRQVRLTTQFQTEEQLSSKKMLSVTWQVVEKSASRNTVKWQREMCLLLSRWQRFAKMITWFIPEDHDTTKELSVVCAQILREVACFVARFGRPDLLWLVNTVTRSFTKRHKAGDNNTAKVDQVHQSNQRLQAILSCGPWELEISNIWFVPWCFICRWLSRFTFNFRMCIVRIWITSVFSTFSAESELFRLERFTSGRFTSAPNCQNVLHFSGISASGSFRLIHLLAFVSSSQLDHVLANESQSLFLF